MEDFMLELLKDTKIGSAHDDSTGRPCKDPSLHAHWQGKHLSASHKKAIAKGCKGRKLTTLHRMRLSFSALGRAPWNKKKNKQLTEIYT